MIFLIGSALCGLAQNMTELIAFRAVQGLGGGGLIVSDDGRRSATSSRRASAAATRASSARVFGVSTVIGPLLGGFFVDNLSWRWIFYVNLAARARRARRDRSAFQPHAEHVAPPDRLPRRRASSPAALSAIVLFTSLGGTTYAWGSPGMLALIVARRRRCSRCSCSSRRAPPSRSCRSRSSATGRSGRRARSASSSGSRSSARSRSCRSTCRSSRATARPSPGC